MKNINWWFMLAVAVFSAVVYSIDDIKIWQAVVLINLFIGADLIGAPTKRAVDLAVTPPTVRSCEV